MKKTKKLAMSSIFCALSVVMIYIGSLTVFDLCTVMLASFFVVLAVIELGGMYPYLIYAVTSVLALLIVPDKTGAMTYAMFAGFYPIAKAAFERKHYVVTWILKLSLFNTSLLLMTVVSSFVLHIDDSILGFKWFVFVFGNLFFLLYDFAFTQTITLYLVKIRSLLKLKNFFE